MHPLSARRRADVTAGLALGGLGVLELLDQVGVLELTFGWLAPALLAAVGAILLARGLSA